MDERVPGGVMEATAGRASRSLTWLVAVGPVILIAVILAAFVWWRPLDALRPVPPVESVAIERTELSPGQISLRLRNDGADPVTVAQVLVNEAYWQHEIGDRSLSRLEATTLRIPYPWDEGMPVEVALITATGVTIVHEIEAAADTPDIGATALWVYTLLGIYIGVIPVAVGLLWFPALRRASPRWIGFFLAFTVGLLAFLLIDTLEEGFEIAGEAGGALNATGLLLMGALAAFLGLTAVESILRRRSGRTIGGLAVAYLVAGGIGLHNLGEGLAVGAAIAAGEIALGTFLVVGFALHNTTEGLAIVSPLGAEGARPGIRHFVALGALAGVPTVFGAWIGGFSFAPAWAALAFGVAAGAIAQVVWVIARTLPEPARLSRAIGALGFVAGLVVMYATGLVAG